MAAYSEHGMVELKLLGEINKANSNITTLNFRRSNLDLFRNFLRRIPWNTMLERRGV